MTELALPQLNFVAACLALFVLVLAGLFVSGSAVPEVLQRAAGRATPGNLGAIRVLTAGILLASALWEDLPSSADIPAAMRQPMGVMNWYYEVPGFAELTRSATGLAAFQWTLIALLALATVGLFTRVTVPLAALGYLALGGLFRQYCWFYHTGLIPVYLLLILSFLPSGHAWSIDRWWRRRRGLPVPPLDETAPVYSWGRYLCWIALALPYTAAALSKLRRGGPMWWDATNFRGILYGDSLDPMEFEFSGGLWLVDAPDWVVETLALAGLGGELFFFLVLLWPKARLVLPAMMLGMHVGILFLQNILFFDLILLQVIFFDWFGRSPRMVVRADQGPAEAIERSTSRYAAAACGLTALLLACWIGRIEYYPLTAMGMYAGKRVEPEIKYSRVVARYRDGREGRAPIEACLPALRDGRYRAQASKTLDAADQRTPTGGALPIMAAFFHTCATRYNRSHPPDEQIVAFAVERWHWNYRDAPHDADHGDLTLKVNFDVGGPDVSIQVWRPTDGPIAHDSSPGP